MVRLFGAHHFITEVSLLGERHVELYPTEGFIAALKKLPRESKVGIELESPDENDILNRDLRKMASEIGCPLASFKGGDYFQTVRNVCLSQGHNVFYLEDLETRLRDNALVIDSHVVQERHGSLIRIVDRESERAHYLRLFRAYEEIWKTELKRLEVFMLERDEKMLAKIAANKLDVVVVGTGHADYWVSGQAGAKERHGINFEQYSADVTAGHNRRDLAFCENNQVDYESVWEFIRVRRLVDLRDKGRFVDEEPAFVGTWDVTRPSLGYFEVFIEEEKDGRLGGRIEDALGTAKFAGWITPRKIDFVKEYVCGTRGRAHNPLHYESGVSKSGRQNHHGRYRNMGNGDLGEFYIQRSGSVNPQELFYSWLRLKEEDGELEKD